jgi:porphobilinogen deaminase
MPVLERILCTHTFLVIVSIENVLPTGAVGNIYFRGNILSVDGKEKVEIEKNIPLNDSENAGTAAANELLQMGADKIVNAIQHAK